MSAVRANYFKFLDFKKKFEDWTQSSRKNVHSMFSFKEWFNLTLFKHDSCSFFGLDPPSLNDYFNKQDFVTVNFS